ncbi:MAG: hypothetical protein HOP23_03860 [Methylococcaceae bacterium]|nr:hypothetical protein [Methylococcaceae bacterium]
MAEIARKMQYKLWNIEISDSISKKGSGYKVDGFNPEFVKILLMQEINQVVVRNEVGQNMWKALTIRQKKLM